MSKHVDPPSGPNQTLSSKTGIRLTLPELAATCVIVAGGVLGWARLDSRISRIEEHMGIPTPAVALRPVLADPLP